ncbi:MAG TPA: hypothetical protein P5287_01640 [bacterium]|nr:hypothetical protein [bacterium]
MKIGKILLAGFAATVVLSVFAIVTDGWLFSWIYKLEPVNVWRPMAKGPGMDYYAGAFALNCLFAAVYAVLKNGVPGKNRYVKGIVFGLCVYAVGVLPGMFLTHIFMTVSSVWVIYGTLLSVIDTPLKALVIAAIYGD